jgi:hypothetical protein
MGQVLGQLAVFGELSVLLDQPHTADVTWETGNSPIRRVRIVGLLPPKKLSS